MAELFILGVLNRVLVPPLGGSPYAEAGHMIKVDGHSLKNGVCCAGKQRKSLECPLWR